MTLEDQFLSKAKFAKLVEETVLQKKLSYMDAIIHICEENSIEIEEVRKFISPIIKDKLEAEARKLNYLPRTNELNFE